MNPQSARIVKEARALFWAWCAVTLAGLLTWLPQKFRYVAGFDSSMGFWIGVPLLATLAFGNEFQYGTLPLLLSQPVDRMNLNFLLVFLTLGIIAKLSLWVFSWRDVAPERVQQYFIFWAVSTLGLIGLGGSLWRAERLLLVLVAILIVPLARIGLAPSALMKNRHR